MQCVPWSEALGRMQNVFCDGPAKKKKNTLPELNYEDRSKKPNWKDSLYKIMVS